MWFFSYVSQHKGEGWVPWRLGQVRPDFLFWWLPLCCLPFNPHMPLLGVIQELLGWYGCDRFISQKSRVGPGNLTNGQSQYLQIKFESGQCSRNQFNISFYSDPTVKHSTTVFSKTLQCKGMHNIRCEWTPSYFLHFLLFVPWSDNLILIVWEVLRAVSPNLVCHWLSLDGLFVAIIAGKKCSDWVLTG